MAQEEFKVPLLKKKYHENCPGCKVDQMKELQQGIPIRSASFFTLSIPLLHETEEDIGCYAGYVGVGEFYIDEFCNF
ncbi:hypothetical protein CCACVL1_05503 [Corchorus capsularis]|uniref:Uncharacterized protein n=1 Tax=Corchorus capsularis TaxID=210143 RepID=A0A1R3JK18_COCAP|nr:hypothetical protein CCACVL1_05503 [Corchorus capsularis]